MKKKKKDVNKLSNVLYLLPLNNSYSRQEEVFKKEIKNSLRSLK